MNTTLQNLIVRMPGSGRIFKVETDPSPKPAPLTLRRLDREPREQAHVYRTRTEVLAMEVMEPRSGAHRELLAATRAFMDALKIFAHSDDDVLPEAVEETGLRLVDLINAQEAREAARVG